MEYPRLKVHSLQTGHGKDLSQRQFMAITCLPEINWKYDDFRSLKSQRCGSVRLACLLTIIESDRRSPRDPSLFFFVTYWRKPKKNEQNGRFLEFVQASDGPAR
jgi:hypothetical protein